VASMFWISVLYNLFLRQIERGFETALNRPFNQRPSVIVLTNLGAFDPDQFDFGVPLTDMYRISQAAFAPALVISVSSFCKKLTFAINYPSRAIRTEDIERFLDVFVEELSPPIARALEATAT
jgi:NRPS condensation-like uncharacterized protein